MSLNLWSLAIFRSVFSFVNQHCCFREEVTQHFCFEIKQTDKQTNSLSTELIILIGHRKEMRKLFTVAKISLRSPADRPFSKMAAKNSSKLKVATIKNVYQH